MDLQDYTNKKNTVAQALQRLQILADDLHLKNQAKDFEQSFIQLGRESFELAVVGEFSRGKSTFINAMLGHRILPSSKKPTTTVISKIIYEDEPTYEIVYKSGKVKHMNEASFLKLTAPKEAEESDTINWKKYLGLKEDISKIDYALVGYPLEFCRDNVEIVDTPGINDINTGRVDITYRYVDQADAIIMVLAANQILTQSEADFVKRMIEDNHIADIFFVINFKDVLSPEEEPDAIAFAKEHLQALIKDLDRPLRMFLLSSKGALVYRRVQNGEKLKPSTLRFKPKTLEETGFPEFEAALGKFLNDGKGAIKLRKYIQRGIIGAGVLEKDLRTRMEISKHSADEIQQKLDTMKPVFRKSKSRAEEIVSDMRLNLFNVQGSLEDICTNASYNMRKVIEETVDNYDGEWTSKAISKTVGRVMAKEKMKLIDAVKQKEEEALRKEFAIAQQEMAKIWQDVDTEYQSSWNLPAIVMEQPKDIDLNLDTSTNDDPSIGSIIGGAGIGALVAGVIGSATLPFMILGGLAAMFFGGNDSNSDEARNQKQKEKLKRDLRKHYQNEYDKMGKQVLKQYQEIIAKYCEKLNQIVQARLEDMQGQLQDIIQQKTIREKDAAKEQERLKQMLQEVKNVRSQLRINVIGG